MTDHMLGLFGNKIPRNETKNSTNLQAEVVFSCLKVKQAITDWRSFIKV